MKRPWKNRIWFWKPDFWLGWDMFKPFFTGGDEFDWHTVVIGFPWTGRIIIATRPCPQTGKCKGAEEERNEFGLTLAKWPVDMYGVNHLTGEDPAKPCRGLNTNICVGEGCYGEACIK